MGFTIRGRVHFTDGAFTATVCALPLETSALAEIRTFDCPSREEALALLGSMAQGLRQELAARGDSGFIEDSVSFE